MSVFQTDKIRHNLAAAGDRAELRETYVDAARFPNLPMMNSETMWDFHVQNSMTSQHPITKLRLARTMELLTNPLGRVLDFGAGYGDIIPLLLERFPDLDYTGIDISSKAIERLRSQYPQLQFVTLRESAELGLDKRYHTVLALEILEHIEIPLLHAVYSMLHRFLQPAGFLIASVPVHENLESITYVCAHCGELQNVNGHVRSYTPALIREEMQLFGFVPIWEKPVDLNGPITNVIIKARKSNLWRP